MKKVKFTKPKFTWFTKQLPIGKIRHTPNNFKLKTEEGKDRFDMSVGKFGRAGSIIVNAANPDGTYYLINGNTNLDKAKELGEKTISASIPTKKLSPKEFEEMAALFDAIRAGEVDMLRIREELGTTKDFFKDWGFEMPAKALKNLAELEKAEIKGNKQIKKDEVKNEVAPAPLTLVFTIGEREEYIRIAEGLYTRFKTDNVTDLSLKVLRYIKKH